MSATGMDHAGTYPTTTLKITRQGQDIELTLVEGMPIGEMSFNV